MANVLKLRKTSTSLWGSQTLNLGKVSFQQTVLTFKAKYNEIWLLSWDLRANDILE